MQIPGIRGEIFAGTSTWTTKHLKTSAKEEDTFKCPADMPRVGALVLKLCRALWLYMFVM